MKFAVILVLLRDKSFIYDRFLGMLCAFLGKYQLTH